MVKTSACLVVKGVEGVRGQVGLTACGHGNWPVLAPLNASNVPMFHPVKYL